ncbi:MAG: hypothetical protein KAR62_08040 [Sphingomonadales bacterium]|nr:hypothetical protein [Sphingomonadales bacterium]
MVSIKKTSKEIIKKVNWYLATPIAILITAMLLYPFGSWYFLEDFQILIGSTFVIIAAYLGHKSNQKLQEERDGLSRKRQKEREVSIALGKTTILLLNIQMALDELDMWKVVYNHNFSTGGFDANENYNTLLNNITGNNYYLTSSKDLLSNHGGDIAIFSSLLLNKISECSNSIEKLNWIIKNDSGRNKKNQEYNNLRMNKIATLRMSTIARYSKTLHNLLLLLNNLYLSDCKENDYTPITIDISIIITNRDEWDVIINQINKPDPQKNTDAKKIAPSGVN